MIISCPQCSARFMVDEKILIPKGRLVRCTKCKHSWHAAPPSSETDGVDQDAKSLQDINSQKNDPQKDQKKQAINKTAPSEEQNKTQENNPDDGLSLAINSRKKKRSRLSSGAKTRNLPAVQENKNPDKWGWVALASFSILILGGFFLMPTFVTGFWPSSAELYKKLHLTANEASEHHEAQEETEIPISKRLALKKLQAVPSFENGVNILTISGEIHNLTEENQETVGISISLVDEDSKSIRQWNISPEAKNITGHGFIIFSSALPNPPLETRDIRVDFIKKNNKDIH